MKLTTSEIILWAVLAILIGIMLGKNDDNSTQSNIAHTRNSVQQGYVYTADTLRSIKGKVDRDRWFKILNPQICKTIRNLRLNPKKTRRGKKVKAQKIHQKRSVELENLITIQCKRESKIKRQNTNLHIMLANVQSLKPKELLCLDHIVGINTDLCILTETWLKNEDSIWLQGCELNKNGWKILSIYREDRTGGSIALVYKSKHNSKMVRKGKTRSFEYGIWHISSANTKLSIVAIYHPPYTNKNPITNNMFIDDFTDWLVEEIMLHDNLLILGNFNLHINHLDNPKTGIFLDTVTAMGLNQHVNFATHHLGNILDVVLLEELSQFQILSCKPGFYLLDHCMVEVDISLPRDDLVRKTITYRNIKGMDSEKFIQDAKFDDLLQLENLDELIMAFENNVNEAIDQHAPEKTKIITLVEVWYSLEQYIGLLEDKLSSTTVDFIRS